MRRSFLALEVAVQSAHTKSVMSCQAVPHVGPLIRKQTDTYVQSSIWYIAGSYYYLQRGRTVAFVPLCIFPSRLDTQQYRS